MLRGRNQSIVLNSMATSQLNSDHLLPMWKASPCRAGVAELGLGTETIGPSHKFKPTRLVVEGDPRPSGSDRYILALDIAGLFQALAKSAQTADHRI